MSRHYHCLNCDEPVSKNFCPNCGQKADTHKITVKHFIFHDILHGVWHFERGILFTLKESLIRPGQAALDYIKGKRIRYYNVFYLSLLTIALNVLLLHIYDELKPSYIFDSPENNAPNLNSFFTENVKTILFSIVPVLGLIAFIVFRRLKLNIAEHFIVAGMCLLGMLQLTVVFCFMNFLNEQFSLMVFGILEVFSFFLIPLFPIWTYFNLVNKTYTRLGTFWRIVVFYFLVLLVIILILSAIIYILTKGSGDFYINI